MGVAFINTNTIASQQASVATFSYSITAGSDLAVAFISVRDVNVPSAVTWNGASMTKAGTEAVNNTFAPTFGYSLWWIAAPATGTHNLVVTAAGSSEIGAGLIGVSGAHQTVPVSAYFSSTDDVFGAGGTYAKTFSSASDQLTVTGLGYPISLTGTDQTIDGNQGGGNIGNAHDHCTTPAASVTHTWTGTASQRTAFAGFSILPASAGGATWGPLLGGQNNRLVVAA